MYTRNTSSTHTLQTGFTVLEMVVVISIFSILAGITLANFGAFKSSTDFDVSVQEIALTIKEMQQNAMAGKVPEVDPSLKQYPASTWRTAYGMYFSIHAPFNPNMMPDKMIEYYNFYDQNVDPSTGLTVDNFALSNLTGGSSTTCNDHDYECLKEITPTNNGLKLERICDGTYPTADCTIQSVSVLFRRPYPDAHMVINSNPHSGSFDGPYTKPLGSVDLVFSQSGISGYNVLTINPVGVISVRRVQ